MKSYLEAGQIVNTHGIRGDLRLMPWSDKPDFLAAFQTVYIDGAAHQVESVRPYKHMALLKLRGVDDVNSAMLYKNKIVHIARADIQLEDGQYFLQDAIGLPVFDESSAAEIGTVSDILELPAGNVLVVRGTQEHLIPMVPEFIRSVDIAGSRITVQLIEGM